MKKISKIFLIGLLTSSYFAICSFVPNKVVKPSELIEEQEHIKKERTKPNAKTRDGFAILLYFSDSKNQAENIRKEFRKKYTDYNCEVEWNEPKFKVLAGNFLTKAEAVALLYKIKDQYPRAMIVKTKI